MAVTATRKSLLGKQEQREFLERLSELARSGMPLTQGLRAAAGEATTHRLAAQLRSLAGQLESGAKWDAMQAGGLPPHVLGIIHAGIESGNLGDAP